MEARLSGRIVAADEVQSAAKAESATTTAPAASAATSVPSAATSNSLRVPAADPALPPEASEAIEALPPAIPSEEGAPNAWPDEAAESAMLGELRERGDANVSAPPGAAAAATAAAAREAEEIVDPKSLPSLDELMKRIPPEVRETLDDLFRAKFVRVTRVPKKALKS